MLHMHFGDWGTKIKDIISNLPSPPRRNGKIGTLLYFLITGIPSFLGNIFPFPVYINMINHILSIFYLLHCYLPCTYMHKNRYYTSCLYFLCLFLELSIVGIGQVEKKEVEGSNIGYECIFLPITTRRREIPT